MDMEYDARPVNIPSAFQNNHRRQSQRSSAVLITPGPPPQVQIPSIPSSSIPPVSFPQRQFLPRRPFGTGSTEDFTLVAVDHPPQNARPLPSDNSPRTLPQPLPRRPTLEAAVEQHQMIQDSSNPASALEQPHSSRQSSRRALTEALRLAQEAVLLDSQNDDPIAAFRAYARSVTLLGEVMERVIRGDRDTDPRRRSGRLRTEGAREDEARRLKSIVRDSSLRLRSTMIYFGLLARYVR